MNLSKQIIIESNVNYILRMSLEDMSKIIKTEAKIEKFLKEQSSNSRMCEID